MTVAETTLVWTEEATSRERWEGLVGESMRRLAQAAVGERFPHAVLLVGPERLGRELVALELAAILTCPEDQEPWCECSSCRRVRRFVHPDVVVVQGSGATSRISIEQIRGIVEQAPGKPFEARHRVWVLDGVEASRLGTEAANAFLKTLEEPAGHVRFVLLAANPEAVLATIRSRCQHVVLPGIVAAASWLGNEGVPELAGWAIEQGDGLESEVDRVKSALSSRMDEGELLPLLKTTRMLANQPWVFEVFQAAALQLAAESERGESSQSYVELASELARIEQQTKALNLNRTRQLLSCVLSWGTS